MKEIFSYKRFGKLVKNDIVRYLPKYYGGILIFLAFMPGIWAFISFFGESPMGVNTRLILIAISTFLCTFIAPFRIYGSTNHKKWGVDFTMLPASSLEKFLSMLLISSILLPIIFITLAILIDIILTTIPTGAYNEYLGFTDIFTFEKIKTFGEIILFMCFALCGNMLFRKNKLSQTVLSMFTMSVLMSFIISTSVYQYAKRITYMKDGEVHKLITGEKLADSTLNSNTILIEETMESDNKSVTITKNEKQYTFRNHNINDSLVNFINDNYRFLYILLNIITYIIIPLLMYYITFARIRKQQL